MCNNEQGIQREMVRFSIEHHDDKINCEDYEAHFILMCSVKGLGGTIIKHIKARGKPFNGLYLADTPEKGISLYLTKNNLRNFMD